MSEDLLTEVVILKLEHARYKEALLQIEGGYNIEWTHHKSGWDVVEAHKEIAKTALYAELPSL